MTNGKNIFLEELKDLPEPVNDGTNWYNYRYQLRKHMLKDPWEDFRKWPVCLLTMYIESRIPSAVDEAKHTNGRPAEALSHFEYENGTAIRQAHTLWQYEKQTGVDPLTLNSIVEFGAGYGELPLILYFLDYQGQYTSYDFPEVLLLQRWYLHTNGADVSRYRFYSEFDPL